MRARRTRIRLRIIFLLLLSGIVFSHRIIAYVSASVISDRNSIRALLLLPKELRKFDIDEHIEGQDWYVYRVCREHKRWPYWRLHVFTTADRLEHFKAVLQDYLGHDRRCRQINAGVNRASSCLVATDPNLEPALVEYRVDTDAEELRVTFTYRDSGHSYWAFKARFRAFVDSILGGRRPVTRVRDVDAITGATRIIDDYRG